MGDEVVVVNVPQPPKDTDRVATAFGVLESAAIAAGDFVVHLGPDGVNWNAPTFWIGLVIAMLRGVMGFYTNKAAGGTTTIQTGQHATTNVMEGKTS